MILHLFRHGIAEERDPSRYPDDRLRPLSKQGWARTTRAAAGMFELGVTIDRLIASPLVRAQQTASIVSSVYGEIPVETLDALAPTEDAESTSRAAEGTATVEERTLLALEETLLSEVSAQKISSSIRPFNLEERAVMIVGHEPNFSRLIGFLMTRHPERLSIDVKKASLVTLDVEWRSSSPRSVLRSMIPPAVLRAVSNS